MNKNKTLILILFLLGIFLGAIDTGIIAPARNLIQNSFGISQSLGTWMITIYTLAYAVSMPIVSKLGDKYGYKKIYVFGIATFGLGSLLCGVSNFYGGFPLLLIGRIIQAIGGGGIIPIANAFIGNSFPEAKRGTALGLIGMTYGLGNTLGPTFGSAVISLAGSSNWGWIFLVNVPICLIILLLSYNIEDSKAKVQKPMDFLGGILLGGVIGSLMYALTNLDFFNFTESIQKPNVYMYLIIFALLTPLMIMVESKATDPILNIKYFRNKQMLLTLALAIVGGVVMMGLIFIPPFAENVLKLKPGSGGYLATVLAVFSAISAPISGKLIDKKGVRFVLTTGFILNIAGVLFLGLVATKLLNFPSLLIGLISMGLGVGLIMGAPLSYLALKSVPKEESASGVSTMFLVRSISVAVSPTLMIGFVVEASKSMQSKLVGVLKENVPTFNEMQFGGGDVFKSLQYADVTNIVDLLKKAIENSLPSQVSTTVLNSIEPLRDTLTDVFQTVLNTGYTNMFIAFAIISAVGLIITLFLSKDRKALQEKAKEAA